MIIISSKFGQLGNRLTIFAHFIACAAEYDFSVSNVAFDEYASFFAATDVDIFCRFPARRSWFSATRANRSLIFRLTRYIVTGLRRLKFLNVWGNLISITPETRFILDDLENLDTLRASRFTFVEGWQYRGYESLKKHADVVRSYFTPLEKHQRAINALINRIRPCCDMLVGIHIRHGDYSLYADGKYFYSIETNIQFMSQIEKLFPSKRVAFLVCSNVTQKSQMFKDFRVFFGNGHLLEDMYSFARCDFLIGPPSTYTLWSSFYGRVPLLMIYDKDLPIQIENFKVYDVLP